MKFEYRIITVIFTVLLLWIPAWIKFEFMPFPYLLYVIWWYYENLGVSGIIFGIMIAIIGISFYIDSLKAKDKENIQETLAEKRP